MKIRQANEADTEIGGNIDATEQVKVARHSWRVLTGERIAKAASLIGSQAAAAEAAGVSLSTLQRYMKGDVDPSLEATTRIAQASQLTLDWIATGEGPRYRKGYAEQGAQAAFAHSRTAEATAVFGPEEAEKAITDTADRVVAAFLWLRDIAAAEGLDPPRADLANLLRLAVSLARTPENAAALAGVMRSMCN